MGMEGESGEELEAEELAERSEREGATTVAGLTEGGAAGRTCSPGRGETGGSDQTPVSEREMG